MSKGFRIGVIVFIVLAMAGIVFWTFSAFNTAKKENITFVENEFDRLTNILRGVSSTEEFADPFLRERLKALFKSSNPLLAALITDQSGQTVWRIPAEGTYLSKDGTSLSGPTDSTMTYTAQVTGSIALQALYVIMKPAQRLQIIRTAIIAAGVAAIIAIIAIVFGILKNSTPAQTIRSYERPAGKPGPARIQPIPGKTPPASYTTSKGRQQTNDLASSRLATGKPDASSGISEASRQNQKTEPRKFESPPASAITVPGQHDIEFPPSGESPEDKYRAMVRQNVPATKSDMKSKAESPAGFRSGMTGSGMVQGTDAVPPGPIVAIRNPGQNSGPTLSASVHNDQLKPLTSATQATRLEPFKIELSGIQPESVSSSGGKNPLDITGSRQTASSLAADETAKALSDFAASYKDLLIDDEFVSEGTRPAQKNANADSRNPAVSIRQPAILTSDRDKDVVLPEPSLVNASEFSRTGLAAKPSIPDSSGLQTFPHRQDTTPALNITEPPQTFELMPDPRNEKTRVGSGNTEMPSEYTLGLYSPISGLGWERNLPERLDTEISRSSAEGSDVSLLLISYDGLTPKDPMYPSFASSIKDYFSIRDLAFECGPGGFGLILPNIDVKRAVRLAEDLLRSLKTIVSLYRDTSSFLPLYMGISAVAGRAAPAARVIQEASAALQKARKDQTSHIVAFNPDPAKFRKQVSS